MEQNTLTRFLDSFYTERSGVAEVRSVCEKARSFFREITVGDVGIDGFIEVFEVGHPTGVMAGVQIKSGDSYVNEQGTKFRFVSDQNHFGYWARCSVPVIGIVHSPNHGRSVWLDLTGMCDDKRIVEGPYSETIEYTDETDFTPSTLLSRIVPTILKYTHQRRTLWQVQQLVRPQNQKADLLVPSLEVSDDREDAWYELIGTLFGVSSEAEIADAGYRLSWYFPAVSKKLQDALLERLSRADDASIARILGAVYYFVEMGADKAAELTIDLLSYVPDISGRVERLVRERKMPSAHLETAIQTVEYLDEEFKHELRREVGLTQRQRDEKQ